MKQLLEWHANHTLTSVHEVHTLLAFIYMYSNLVCFVELNSKFPLVSESLLMQLIKERLGQLDCVSKGWVLHGFPLDREQAFALDRAGFIPNK